VSISDGDKFLKLLDPDPPTAERKYQQLRQKLVFYFRHNRCADPENLADEVILRAFRRLEEGVEAHSGVPAYCFGVAEYVLREERRRPQAQELIQEPQPKSTPRAAELTRSEQSILVGEFLSVLTDAERNLITRYYREDRKKLAESEGLSENGLRVRVFRIHQKLQELAAHRMGKKN
jgi:DNA-directed RNA polymerase specialized sigma24 family protein